MAPWVYLQVCDENRSEIRGVVFALPSWLIVSETTSEGTLPDSQTFLPLNRESLKAENIKWK